MNRSQTLVLNLDRKIPNENHFTLATHSLSKIYFINYTECISATMINVHDMYTTCVYRVQNMHRMAHVTGFVSYVMCG